jgi:hypothetical protein
LQDADSKVICTGFFGNDCSNDEVIYNGIKNGIDLL